MRRLALILLLLTCVSVQGQIRIYSTYAENYAATQLQEFLEKGGCQTTFGGKSTGRTVYVGLPSFMKERYKPLLDSLHDDGFFIVGDGKEVVLHGAGEKGTLYAVYAFLEMMGYRLYTPDAMVVPDVSKMQLPKCHIVSNPAFGWREVSYYYPNHSRLYADWHHLHTQADREHMFGMFVHTFQRLLPPSRFFDDHQEWYSLNNGRRSRDGQLCLSNAEVLEVLCQRLADTMQALPTRRIWSVSPNDNYNVCECAACRRLDSLYGGPSGTLIWFVNQVARRFPDKTIATLAYQYTRRAPTSTIRPDSNVLIMLCPIEAGRQAPITQTDPAFRKDMEDWSRLTNNLFIWDYVVQFRNFWNPFPNLHVLQPNLQYFKENGAKMMFEQATGANNVTSWMDIRCYMIAKLMWDPYINIDSVMDDFYQGYYGDAGRYVKEIINTMTAALVQSGQTLNIYGYPVDGADGYLSVERFRQYDSLMKLAWQNAPKHYAGCIEVADSALWFFSMALEFARIELAISRDLKGYFGLDSLPSDSASLQPVIDRIEMFAWDAYNFNVPQMMEMGIGPDECVANWIASLRKRFGENRARHKAVTLRRPATAPYNNAGLTDGEGGIMDYRHRWLGFWGDTLDAVVDLGEPTEIHEVSLDFYFYPLSWIFLPQNIRFYVSNDGKQWQLAGEEHPESPQILATPKIYSFSVSLDTRLNQQQATDGFKHTPSPLRGTPPNLGGELLPQSEPSNSSPKLGEVDARSADGGVCRYLRIVAEPLPEIPAWHRAAGQKAWIFTDEIIVK